MNKFPIQNLADSIHSNHEYYRIRKIWNRRLVLCPCFEWLLTRTIRFDQEGKRSLLTIDMQWSENFVGDGFCTLAFNLSGNQCNLWRRISKLSKHACIS